MNLTIYLISKYWDIGKLIITRQQGETWGKSVVKNLSYDLQAEFPGIQRFSSANLWRMKLFYENYADNEKLAPMVREIGWTHNLVIMEKCKDELEREFYIRMTGKFGWTKYDITLFITAIFNSFVVDSEIAEESQHTVICTSCMHLEYHL